jgi:peroxiredoxin
VWAISSTDPTDKLAAYAGAKGITFPLLSDADLAVTKRFGVVNDARGTMAHPTTLVIDRKGTVRFVRIDFDFTKRPAAADLLAFLKNLKD